MIVAALVVGLLIGALIGVLITGRYATGYWPWQGEDAGW